MDHENELYRNAAAAEKEERKKQRRKTWAQRERAFWKTFLFTEDGKPKSGLMIYTFCLSFVLLALYMLSFHFATEYLTPLLSGVNVTLSNLIVSLGASAAVLLLCWGLHGLLKDKRLVFVGHIWLAVYALAALVTMAILLRGTGAMGTFLIFFGWFIAIPVVLGLAVTYVLFRKDYRPRQAAPEIPAWKRLLQER